MGKDRSRAIAKIDSNLPAKKYKKGTPAQIRLSFEFTGGATKYIEIARALSAINRKFYKSGVYYYVNSVEMYDNADSVVNLHVCPDTWVTRAAFRKGKALFDEMTLRAHDTVSGEMLPKYHDFRVFMTDLHRTTGSTNPSLHDVNDTLVAISPDEWSYSQFVSADSDTGAPADEFNAHMLGPRTGADGNWLSVGLIESYAKTRVTVNNSEPNASNIDAGDPLMNLFDYSSEEVQNDIVSNLDTQGDQPPYDIDTYPGQADGHMQHVARLVTSPEVGRVVQEEGFCAPLGLICVDPIAGMASDNKYTIVLNLAPGTYHGVYAERMV